ncbi:MAG TPA: LacI family DNA-binding transcriptional regulator [bacterium]|nr:LacI family DNA-binding transcriptional regulator [bacterium]
MAGPRATLAQVAGLAHVSIPTASQALSGRARISSETRARVRAAANQLCYTPHAAARRLSLGRSECVAIVPGQNVKGMFSDLFYRVVLTGVAGICDEAGYRMLVAPATRGDTQPPQFVNLALGREVDGVLAIGAADPRWVRETLDLQIPIVLVDNYIPDLPAPAVVNDDEAGAYLAVQHLTALGHVSIALVGADVSYPFGRNVRQGYLRGLRDAGLNRNPAIEIAVPIDTDRARQAATSLFAMSHRPTAVVAATDAIALGVVRAARDRALDVPRDVSIVGMDDIDLAVLINPPLTTVRVQKEEMGRVAAEMLLRWIHGQLPDRGPIVLPNSLIARGTTGGKP